MSRYDSIGEQLEVIKLAIARGAITPDEERVLLRGLLELPSDPPPSAETSQGQERPPG